MAQDLEKTLWASADTLRSNMDPGSYKHVALGLIFLKYISDAFMQKYNFLSSPAGQAIWADPEEPDEYKGENIFFVPPKARWEYLVNRSKQPTIGKDIDEAMQEIEAQNPSLKNVLPKDYSRADLDKARLGQLLDLFHNINFSSEGEGEQDVLGRVYEYFMGQFADAEGKRGGQFFTPRSIVKLLVDMLEPFKGRIYDPCCGSGGMFVYSEKFVKEHAGRIGDMAVYGQEDNPATRRLAVMNLAIRGIESKIEWGDTLLNDLHKDLKADYILANPPFNVSDWSGHLLRDDQRWKYGVPPAGNANYAWLQHIVHHLAPTGTGGVVLANGSMTSNSSGEGDIRKAMIEGGVIDCMVALPNNLFYNTAIPACLWFLARDRKNHKFRDRRGEILFIDARNMGRMITRRHRELTNEDIDTITAAYHNWRNTGGQYADVPGFCKAATIAEVQANNYVLTPGRYVGAADIEDDGVSFEEKMEKLTAELVDQFFRSGDLEQRIKKNLEGIGFKMEDAV
ncbi:MAG: class I SAM-dependent DNA methyltransferase [Bacteroidota bacterium]